MTTRIRRTSLAGVLLAAVAALLPAAAAADSVSIGIQLGTPPPPAPPPVVIAAPPRVVVVPGTAVYHAPDLGFNLFVYGGQYYMFHNGSWFFAAKHAGPWKFVEVGKVPRPVLGVPVKYYKAPPGQAKKQDDNGHPGKGRGPKGKK